MPISESSEKTDRKEDIPDVQLKNETFPSWGQQDLFTSTCSR